MAGGNIARVSPDTDVGAKPSSAVHWSGLGSHASPTLSNAVEKTMRTFRVGKCLATHPHENNNNVQIWVCTSPALSCT